MLKYKQLSFIWMPEEPTQLTGWKYVWLYFFRDALLKRQIFWFRRRQPWQRKSKMVWLNKVTVKKAVEVLLKAGEKRTRSRISAKMIATNTWMAVKRKRKVRQSSVKYILLFYYFNKYIYIINIIIFTTLINQIVLLTVTVNKQKWVPLEIDITKNRNKRDRSPKYHNQREKNGEGIICIYIIIFIK